MAETKTVLATLGKAGLHVEGEWESTTAYERLSVVTYNGSIYISRKSVPVGIVLTNTDYWYLSIDGKAELDKIETEYLAAEANRDAQFEAAETERDAQVQTTVDTLVDSYGYYNHIKPTENRSRNVLTNTVDGELIHVEDAYPTEPREVVVRNEFEQFTTTGKNLFDVYGIGLKNSSSAIQINEDGSIVTSALGSISQFDFNSMTLPAGTYTASISPASDGVYARVNSDGYSFSSNTNPTTFTINETANVVFSIRFPENFAGGTLYYQIELGSTATAYEPYTGGIPSPNPDYPQEIKTLSAVDLETRGRNLLPSYSFDKMTKNGITFEYLGNGVVSISGTSTNAAQIDVKLDKPFWFDKDMYIHMRNPVVYGYMSVALVDDVGRQAGWINSKQENYVGKLIDAKSKTAAYIRFYVAAGITINQQLQISVETTDTVTVYSPYSGTTTHITLTDSEGNPVELCPALPDGTADELVLTDNGDGTASVEAVKPTKKTVFNGTEAWDMTGSTGHAFRLVVSGIRNPSKNSVDNYLLSDAYKHASFDRVYNGNGNNIIGTPSDAYWIAIYDERASSITEYKALLAENPVTVVYPLETPEIVTIGTVPIASIPERISNIWATCSDSEIKLPLSMTYEQDTQLLLDIEKARITDNEIRISNSESEIAKDKEDIDNLLATVKEQDAQISRNEKQIKNLKGITHEWQVDSTDAYAKDVPSGAMPYAELQEVGGKTVVWNQLIENGDFANNALWNISGCALSVSGNEAAISYNASNNNLNFELYLKRETTIGHVFYMSVLAKATSDGAIINFRRPFVLLSSFNLGNTYSRCEAIGTSTEGTMISFAGNIGSQDVTVTAKSFMCIDLTAMFGAGNEPATVEEFRAMFPADYYPYCEPELLSADVVEVESRGKNLANVAYSGTINPSKGADFRKAKIAENIAPGEYAVTCTSSSSTSIKTLAIGEDGKTVYATGFTTNKSILAVESPSLVYIYVDYNTSNNEDVYFTNAQIERGDTATAYSPYRSDTLEIPQAARDLCPLYGASAGSAVNAIDFESRVYVQRVGEYVVDSYTASTAALGTHSNGQVFASFIVTNAKEEGVHINDAGYENTNWTQNDGCIYIPNTGYIVVNDSRFTDRKAIVDIVSESPITIYYELAEPIEVDLSEVLTVDNLLPVEAGGQVIMRNSHGDDYRIPVPSTVEYAIDIQEEVANV